MSNPEPGYNPERARLVLFCHGSRDARWRQPFEKVAAELGRLHGADRVRLAYMEFVGPTLMDVAGEASAERIAHLRVLPMFMSGGGHVSRDVPEQARAVEARFPDLRVEILQAVGEHPVVLDAIGRAAGEALEDRSIGE